MSASKSKGGRRLAWLAWLALVASLLAAAPGAAQAQTGPGDAPTDDDPGGIAPINTPPTITSAEPDKENPYTAINVVWQWSFPDSPRSPVRSNDDHQYNFEAQIASDLNGGPDQWSDLASQATLTVSLSVEGAGATVGATIVLTGTLAHANLQPGDGFHYRVRARFGEGAIDGPWATVGPVSTYSIPSTPTPEDFTALPSPSNPQKTVFLSWQTVPKVAGSTVHYRLDRFNNVEGAWQRADNIQGNAYEQDFTVSNEFTAYRLWAVRDYGALGTVASEMATAHVTPSQPPAPTGVTAATDASQPSKAVVINWTAVADEVGSVTLYQLRFRIASDESAEWEGLGSSSATPTSFHHEGRAPATTYEYQVRATRLGHWAGRNSDWSASATVTTDADIGGL